MDIRNFKGNKYWNEYLDIDPEIPHCLNTYQKRLKDNLLIEVVFVNNQYIKTDLVHEIPCDNGLCIKRIEANNCMNMDDVLRLIELFTDEKYVK